MPPLLEPGAPLAGGPARVRLRTALPEPRPVTRGGELLGWVEQYGPWADGTLELRAGVLRFSLGDGHLLEAPLDDFIAIQPASRTLQLGLRGRRTWSIRFLEDSLMWWEALFQESVRRHWAASGRGEVGCFQPQIGCR